MNGRYLLDTNIVIALIARETSPWNRLTGAGEIFVPSIALGELYYGAYNSARIEVNRAKINGFVAGRAILACDEATAVQYGQVKSSLRAKGRLIPDNDTWIAAIALQHQLTLVSRDRHFSEIDGLPVQAW